MRPRRKSGPKDLSDLAGIRFALVQLFRAGRLGAKRNMGQQVGPTAIDPLDAQRLASVLAVVVKLHEVVELNERIERLEQLLSKNNLPGVRDLLTGSRAA